MFCGIMSKNFSNKREVGEWGSLFWQDQKSPIIKFNYLKILSVVTSSFPFLTLIICAPFVRDQLHQIRDFYCDISFVLWNS